MYVCRRAPVVPSLMRSHDLTVSCCVAQYTFVAVLACGYAFCVQMYYFYLTNSIGGRNGMLVLP